MIGHNNKTISHQSLYLRKIYLKYKIGFKRRHATPRYDRISTEMMKSFDDQAL